MLNRFSWSWPAFLNVSQPQTRWRQSWRGVWREGLSGPGFDLDGHYAATVQPLAEADVGESVEFSELSERSVIALVGLTFEARIAAGPGVLVICRGGDASNLLKLALEAGGRSIISFGVAGGLAPGLFSRDCLFGFGVIGFSAKPPTPAPWSPTPF